MSYVCSVPRLGRILALRWALLRQIGPAEYSLRIVNSFYLQPCYANDSFKSSAERSVAPRADHLRQRQALERELQSCVAPICATGSFPRSGGLFLPSHKLSRRTLVYFCSGVDSPHWPFSVGNNYERDHFVASASADPPAAQPRPSSAEGADAAFAAPDKLMKIKA